MNEIAAAHNFKVDEYSISSPKDLFANNQHLQVQGFYNLVGDPEQDGIKSYAAFLKTYRADKSWTVKEHKDFVEVTKVVDGKTLTIIANDPTKSSPAAFVAQMQELPQYQPFFENGRLSIVFRGHHGDEQEQFIKDLPTKTHLFFDGTCGGFHTAETAGNSHPNLKMFSTKGVSKMTLNEPLIKMLNEQMLKAATTDKDMDWQKMLQTFKDAATTDIQMQYYKSPAEHTLPVFKKSFREIDASRH